MEFSLADGDRVSTICSKRAAIASIVTLTVGRQGVSVAPQRL